jgi:hypothetical protein
VVAEVFVDDGANRVRGFARWALTVLEPIPPVVEFASQLAV